MFAVVALGGTSIRSRGACWSVALPLGLTTWMPSSWGPGDRLQDGDDEASAVRRRQPRDVDLAEDADGADLPVLRGDGVVAQQEGVELELGHRAAYPRLSPPRMPASRAPSAPARPAAAPQSSERRTQAQVSLEPPTSSRSSPPVIRTR